MPEIVWAEIGMAGWHRNGRTEEPDGTVVVEGACPRCDHETAFRIDVGLPGGLGTKSKDVEAGRDAPRLITVICGCGYAHPDRPADSGESGCGAYWYDQEA